MAFGRRRSKKDPGVAAPPRENPQRWEPGEEHYARLRRFLVLAAEARGVRDEAEDLAHNAIIILGEKLNEVTDENHFYALGMEILRGLLLNKWRWDRVRKHIQFEETDVKHLRPDVDGENRLVAYMYTSQLWDCFLAALKRMKEHNRKFFIDYTLIVREFGVSEFARREGMTEDSAKSKYRRLTDQLLACARPCLARMRLGRDADIPKEDLIEWVKERIHLLRRLGQTKD
jgi:DNA-directed RNA polymerase specialized sigma24 family protein